MRIKCYNMKKIQSGKQYNKIYSRRMFFSEHTDKSSQWPNRRKCNEHLRYTIGAMSLGVAQSCSSEKPEQDRGDDDMKLTHHESSRWLGWHGAQLMVIHYGREVWDARFRQLPRRGLTRKCDLIIVFGALVCRRRKPTFTGASLGRVVREGGE